MKALVEGKGISACYNNDVVLFTHINDLTHIPKTDFILEGFFFAFVLKGHASIIVSEHEYELKAGDLFACNPKNILDNSMISMDFEIRGLYIEPHYIESLASKINLDWSLRLMAQSHEVAHCSEKDVKRLMMFTDLLHEKLTDEDSENKSRTIDCLMMGMAYEMFDMRKRHGNDPMQQQHYRMAEYTFQRFIKMLQKPDTPFLSVAGYAEQLNITPKYFSAICKKLTGRTASYIVHDEIIKTSKILMRDNSKSIKQVAHELGFNNQSHFGTFFKRETGMSPYYYRNRILDL